MARTVYFKTALTGGTVNSLDGIDGNNLVVGDAAEVIHNGIKESFYLSTDASTEIAPNVYTPDSNLGSWAWKNQSNWLVTTTSAPSQVTGKLKAYGVSILNTTKAGVYVLDTPFAGAYKEVVCRSTFSLGIKGSSVAATHAVKFGNSGSTISVVAMVCATSKTRTRQGRSLRLMGASTVLWNILGGSTVGLTFSTST